MIGAKGVANRPCYRPDLFALVATVVGGVYEVDALAANGATVDKDTALDNVVAVSANGLNRSELVVAEQVVTANNRAVFTMTGPVQVLVNGTIAKGDSLMGSAGNTYLVPKSGTPRAVAQALEANASGTGRIWVRFNGGATAAS